MGSYQTFPHFPKLPILVNVLSSQLLNVLLKKYYLQVKKRDDLRIILSSVEPRVRASANKLQRNYRNENIVISYHIIIIAFFFIGIHNRNENNIKIHFTQIPMG